MSVQGVFANSPQKNVILKPDFPSIERELQASDSIQESINIRKKHLKEINTLREFHQLAKVEPLVSESESYFESYKEEVEAFLINNIENFLKKGNKTDKEYFLTKVYPALRGSYHSFSLAQKGLIFVESCDDFKKYALKTDRGLIKIHGPEYCPLNDSILYRLFPILARPILLSEGQFKTIDLRYLFYIKKLYISASGLRNDAYFDVMVNGETKGTVYVPGRDPSYIISVEDYADQITLRSFSGTAMIESLQVEGF